MSDSRMIVPNFEDDVKPLTIIGLGNELLSDDGVGIRVVEELKKRRFTRPVVFEELAIGGLELLDYLVGFEECMIVDAIASGKEPAGTLFRFVQSPDDEPLKLASSHQIDLGQVLSLARLLGARLPERVTVYGVEVTDTTTFREGLTEDVARAVPGLVNMISNDVEYQLKLSPGRSGEWQTFHEQAIL
jgi:hydrogenase maturation protease